MSDPQIRAAWPDGRAAVEALFTQASTGLAKEASTRLTAQGIAPWRCPPLRDPTTTALRRGEVFLVPRRQRPAGMLPPDGFADPEFRRAADRPDSTPGSRTE